MRCETNQVDLVNQQVSELKRFSKVAHVLRGVVGLLWLPGLQSRFDGPRRVAQPPRSDRGPAARPIAVTMEVTPASGLTLAGAISRPRDEKLVYSTIFRYEFTQPMVRGATGEVLSPDNAVLARRALGLLRSLVRFGERRLFQPRSAYLNPARHPVFLVPFIDGQEKIDEDKLERFTKGMHPHLVESYRERLREEMCDRLTLPGSALVNAAIVPDAAIAEVLNRQDGYEDFAPVLGVPHWNPVEGLHEMPNPAAVLLAQHGVQDLEAVSPETLDALAADFRGAVPLGERLLDDEIYDALVNPKAPVRCAAGVAGLDERRVAMAMRRAAHGTRAAWEATDEDFLRAARWPNEPLYLSRLSVTQLVEAEELMQLPAPYAGHFLPPLDWQPPRRSAIKAV